jgi:hypothetical protein
VASAPNGPFAPNRSGERSHCRAAALIAYFDTSALIKTLLEEDGSQLADELWTSPAFVDI